MKNYITNRRKAFTFVETMVATGMLSMFGIMFYAASTLTTVLYVKNYSVNESHGYVRGVCENLLNKVHHAVEPPKLLDNTGAETAGNAATHGISCLVQSSTRPFYLAGATAINQKTMVVKKDNVQSAPKKGDFIFMSQIRGATTLAQSSVFYAEVITAVPTGANTTVTFTNNLSTYFDPPLIGSPSLTADQPLNVLNRCAFIAITTNGATNLRFYPEYMKIGGGGPSAVTAAVFNDPKNFSNITGIVPLEGQTESKPFMYSDTEKRFLDLHFRTISRKVDKRGFNNYNYYQSFKTVIAYRSVTQQILQPL